MLTVILSITLHQFCETNQKVAVVVMLRNESCEFVCSIFGSAPIAFQYFDKQSIVSLEIYVLNNNCDRFTNQTKCIDRNMYL